MRRHPIAPAILALLLAACGGGGGGGTSTDLTKLVANARAAGSAHFELIILFGPEEESFNATGTGQIDFADELGAMTFEFGELPGAEALGSFPTTYELVFHGSVVYMSFGDFFALPDGKTWIAMDGAALSGTTGQNPLSQNDPTNMLGLLEGISSDGVIEKGAEDVRGVATTRYEANIDLDKALANVPEEQREQVRGMVQGMTDGEFPVTVWVDGDGLLRRFSMNFNVASQTTSFRMELFDYGAPVEVSLPPADETLEVSSQEELQQILSGALSGAQ